MSSLVGAILVHQGIKWVPTPYARSQGVTPEHLGFIPTFLNAADPRPAAQQIDANYQHGGGWRPTKPTKWKFHTNWGDPLCQDISATITYPGDPPKEALFIACLHDTEMILVFEAGWTLILQPDDTFEIDRLD